LKGKNTKVIRSDPEFYEKFIKDIQLQKMKKQGKFTTPRRITLAVTRHPLISKIKKDIIDADLK